MNSRQLQYALELAKTRNFSQVSEKLNISQPTLSKQIISLENSLGIKLFERSTASVSLTPAGEHFIRHAQELLYREDQLLRSLELFKSGEKGRLTVGISPFRNLCMMPRIIEKFKQKYPGVQIVLHETNSDQLRKEAAEGKYDFAVVNLPVDDTLLDTILLEEEQLVLAVPNAMAASLPHSPDDPLLEIDFSVCKDLPFIVVAPSQEMRQYFDKLCACHDITPRISVEIAGGVTAAWSMARSGLGATLLPLHFVGDNRFDENLTLFTLKNATYTRQPVIALRRGQYLSPYAKYAIDLMTNAHPED